MGWAVNTNSNTADRGIILGRMVPKGGSRLHLVSVIPSLASSAAIRRSHIWAMDQPPARAKPLTAAISGFQVWGHI